MKSIQKLTILVFFATLILSCDNNDIINENLIIGNWKLTEAYISSGGSQHWVTVNDGYELIFSSNQNFTSTRYTSCDGGIYSINDDLSTLSFDYNCTGFNDVAQGSDGLITYSIETFDKNYFVLTPTSGPVCIEGCSYKFVKL